MSLLTVILASILLQGRVLLHNDQTGNSDISETPGDYVMVYAPALRIGTLSDEQGNYSITLPAGDVELEFSRIGYAVHRQKFNNMGESSSLILPTITLEPQTLMITAAIVTPDGMSPADYIIERVINKTKATKNKNLSYEADIRYDFKTHEIPLMASALSGGQQGMTKFAGALMGIGPLVKYCMGTDDISAYAQVHRSVVKGKGRDSNGRIVKSNPDPLPEKVQRNIIDFFGKIDLYDLLYGAGCNMGQSFVKDHKFQLEGSYEYNDKLVHVLNCKAYHMDIRLHVVDQEWSVMKMQLIRGRNELIRIEAREMAGGIYMPVTFIMNPTITKIRHEQIPSLIKYVQDNKQLKKAGKARLIGILEERLRNKEDFNPYIACSFSVKYL